MSTVRTVSIKQHIALCYLHLWCYSLSGSHPWKRPEKIRVGKWSERQIKYRQWIRVSRPEPFPVLSEMTRETLLWYHCVWPTSCSSPGQKWSKCRKVKLNSSHLLFLCLPPRVIDVRVGGGCICEEKRLQRESLSLGRIGLSSIKWDWSQSDEHRFFSFLFSGSSSDCRQWTSLFLRTSSPTHAMCPSQRHL